jgi:hypothetical protein
MTDEDPWIGSDVVASHLKVTRAAVSNWYKRQLPGLPAPTEVKHNTGRPTRIWRQSQLAEWDEWSDRTRTQGKGKISRLKAELAEAQAEIARLKGDDDR